MLTVPDKPFRRRRRPPRSAPPAPAAPVLVAAAYDAEGRVLTLAFDRAVDVAAFDAGQVTVDDPLALGARLAGTAGTAAPGAAVVTVDLVETAPAAGDAVTLTATAANGVVAADGGAAWAGVTAVELPFP